MSELAKYTKTRAAHDSEFADGLESGYTDFKVDLTQEQVAEQLDEDNEAKQSEGKSGRPVIALQPRRTVVREAGNPRRSGRS